ncbi:DUF559 domain-containing protein [Limnothrix sp. FACHB-1083]|uniref:BRO family protein n=1 Tax=unclassified Limnothrix TaxID=2632864 RepID=UPI001680A219|nr:MULTISPECIES: BRO family protein [unclassified Limnothrix]MBD2161371.1 DUF559 domain-containing protein [Limnothrix sp. FACHB-1083]MBD2192117.1 DUF559 domain-containing protein [Limnothrix sp. FACHB-1088]
MFTIPFGCREIRAIDAPDGTWFVAKDVCAALGLDNTSQSLSRLEKWMKGKERVAGIAGGPQKTNVINTAGLKKLITTSRSPKAQDLAYALGIDVAYAPPKEAECIRIIAAALADQTPIHQFPILSYRIDLYFPRGRVAVECDENGHRGKHRADAVRQREITEALHCSFIRFNPDAHDFNVGRVIHDIREALFFPY